MKLSDLRVLHFDTIDSRPSTECDAWVIDTCQRTVIISTVDTLLTWNGGAGAPCTFIGTDAYAFLLGFACGLESELIGETEIFGQVKDSWKAFSANKSGLAKELSPLIQLLFKDTKEIRAYHLTHTGSSSYGSQVRKLIGGSLTGSILLIGAGQLAQSVAPWLDAQELIIWNRTINKAYSLCDAVKAKNPQQVCRVLPGNTQAELLAWAKADNVVVCVPADPLRDAERVMAWSGRGQIIHLGVDDVKATAWGDINNIVTLTTLFARLREHSVVRISCLNKATEICREKAILRGLGSAQTHCWEDLSAFI